MSGTNLLISSRSTCQIYSLRVAYSIWSLFTFIYSKNPFDNTEVERPLKREEIADRRPTDWWRERKRDGEASCYEIPLWCSATTWDEKCGLSSPVFERNINEKSPSFEIVANMTDDKSLMFFSLFLKSWSKCINVGTSSAFTTYCSLKTLFVHRTLSPISTIPTVISLNLFIWLFIMYFGQSDK